MKEKRSLIPRGCTVPSLEMRRISCLAAIVATRNGTDGSNFHVRNAMTTRIEISGNMLASIVGRWLYHNHEITSTIITISSPPPP